MKGKYLNPKADLTFKKVFGEHEDLVMSLLNALLPLDAGKQIEHVEYMTPEMVPENPGKKFSIVDVRCRETGGRHFIVEMQMNWKNEFEQRVILNASKAVVKHLKGSEGYSLLQPVYALNLINDVGFDAGPDEFYHDYAIVNVEHTDRIIEGLRFVFVKLPKFKPQNIKEKGGTQDYRVSWKGNRMMVLWLRFLTEIDSDTSEVAAELLEDPQISKALKILEKSAYNEAELSAYEHYWDGVYYERGAIRHGYKQGMEEGKKQGMAQGMAQANRENAAKMKADGMATELIVKYTGLTIEEIGTL